MSDISHITLPDSNTYNLIDATVPHTSETAASGGTALSLVTTGEKYIWNSSSALSGLSDVAITSLTNNDILQYNSTLGKWENKDAKADRVPLPADYDATSTYAVGDFCTYNGDAYVCVTTISTPEAWDSSHWILDSQQDYLHSINPSGIGSFSLNRRNGTTIGILSFAAGRNGTASGDYSHAEGDGANAIGMSSHAEGISTTASREGAHAEGAGTTASNIDAHAEGWRTTASGVASHAEGFCTIARGDHSHAEGYYTTAKFAHQHVFGEYNVVDPASTPINYRGNYVEIVGNGTADDARSNARTLDWSGNEVLAGSLTATQINGTLPYDNTSSGLVATNMQDAIDEVYGTFGTLDSVITGSPSSSKTLTAFSETDGVVTATFSDISITKSQVSDFPVSESAVSGGTTLSLVTTGEKYNWNTSPRMTTNSYPTLFDQDGNNNWIRIGTNNSYGLLPPNSGSAGSGHGNLGASGWYWNNIYVDNVNSTSVLNRTSFVASSTSYSANNMRGQTRFLYTTHGVPQSGTTVSFDSSNNDNYSLQLNGNYSGATANARLSFRTRNGDASKWSNWLYCCPVYRFNTRIEPNTSVTLYVPSEMRNGTYGDSYFLVLSGNYGTGGLYFLTPNTATSHTMTITAIKSAGSTTLATVSDDWGFKITLGGVAYYATLIRLS